MVYSSSFQRGVFNGVLFFIPTRPNEESSTYESRRTQELFHGLASYHIRGLLQL